MNNSCDIIVTKVDDVHAKVVCDRGIQYELHEYFSFFAPNYKFHPKFKNKLWDGKLRLYSLKTNFLYIGLLYKLIQFAKEYEYTIHFNSGIFTKSDVAFDEEIMAESKYEPRDYQVNAIKHALDEKRCVLVSPTGSGKSFIIYNIIRHIAEKTLVIVPTINLVYQMRSDFIDYNPEIEDMIHCITAGNEKDSDRPIIISTWQSIFRLPEHWFDQFKVVIGDESHQYKATSLVAIMEKCKNIEWRVGTTGTVSNQNSTVNSLTLEGLFGPIKKVASTKELMDKKHLSNFRIKALVLKYPKEESISVRNLSSYHDEVKYFTEHSRRNKFISKLALSQQNNTLILFQLVESHGKILYNMISSMNDGTKKIHFISGETSAEERENIRTSLEKSDNNIIVASYGTFSTGANIKNLHNVIFAFGFKSRIKNLQSIGRSLRLNDNKDIATLYDIVDDCSVKSKKNFSVKHFIERLTIYNEEKFDFKIHNINL